MGVPMARLLALLLLAAPQFQDGGDAREFERRYAECLSQAAALHVELAEYLEKQGQLAWARYQYEWALELSPSNAAAAAALARADVDWKNKHERFEEIGKGAVKLEVVSRQDWDSGLGPMFHFELRVKSEASRETVTLYTLRKKSNGRMTERTSFTTCGPRSSSGGQYSFYLNSEPVIEEFRKAEAKDVEAVIVKVLAKNAAYPRIVSDIAARYESKGKVVAKAFRDLGVFCAGRGLKEEAAKANRMCIELEREHEDARKDLGFVKDSYDVANLHAEGVRTAPRWRLPEEVSFRDKIFRAMADQDCGQKGQWEGNTGWSTKGLFVYSVPPTADADAQELIRLANACIKHFNASVGNGTDCFERAGPFFYRCDRRIKEKWQTVELRRREGIYFVVDFVFSEGLSDLIGMDNRDFTIGGRGKWAAFGVDLVVTKALAGYCSFTVSDKGTDQLPVLDEGVLGEATADWHGFVRSTVIDGTYRPPGKVMGVSANTLDNFGKMQLWSHFHYLFMTQHNKFWAFMREFGENKRDETGLASFKKIFGAEFDGIEKDWRAFVMRNY
jgi:tetratricopeptide (TPR) repeat protein